MNAMTRPAQMQTLAPKEQELPTYDARAMMPDGVQARIVLDRQVYVLRITRAGKLILTK